MHLSRRTGNHAVHEKGVGGTSVCGPCLPPMRSRAGDGRCGATGNRGKIWNRKSECRNQASHSAPCVPRLSNDKKLSLSPCHVLPSPTRCPEVMMNVPGDKQLRPGWTQSGHTPLFFLQPSTLTQPSGGSKKTKQGHQARGYVG